MMKVARAEVHRLDLAAKAQRKHEQDDKAAGATEVLNQENEDLKKKVQAMQADKKALVQTLRQMLAKNSTKIFRQQADRANQMKFAMEMKLGKERQSLEAQLGESQNKIQEAQNKCEDTRELAQSLQEENLALRKHYKDVKEKLAKSSQTAKDLQLDKANLVATMHGLMRDTTRAKQELHSEKAVEQKEEKEIEADRAKLAKLLPKPKVKRHPKPSKQKSKKALGHKHEESMAAQLAHLKAIDHYIIRSAEASAAEMDIDLEKTQKVQEQQEESAAKAEKLLAERAGEVQPEDPAEEKVQEKAVDEAAMAANSAAPTGKELNSGLSGWLGIKAPLPKKAVADAIPKDANGLSPIDALDPPAVKKEKKAEAPKKEVDDDDGSGEIASLLAQAKSQLKAMDDPDA
jgi:hypothetical protein